MSDLDTHDKLFKVHNSIIDREKVIARQKNLQKRFDLDRQTTRAGENEKWQKIQYEFCINFDSLLFEKEKEERIAYFWQGIREFIESSMLC